MTKSMCKDIDAKRLLSREIAIALAFKVMALCLLYFLFFDHAHRTVVTPEKMAAFLADKQPSSQR
jgi:hypothetical protein